LEQEDPDFKMEDRKPESDEEEVLFFFREQLHRMGISFLLFPCSSFSYCVAHLGDKLNERADAEKKSAAGRSETVLYQQTRSFIKPFFAKVFSSLFLTWFDWLWLFCLFVICSVANASWRRAF